MEAFVRHFVDGLFLLTTLNGIVHPLLREAQNPYGFGLAKGGGRR